LRDIAESSLGTTVPASLYWLTGFVPGAPGFKPPAARFPAGLVAVIVLFAVTKLGGICTLKSLSPSSCP